MEKSGNIFDKLERYRGAAGRTYSKALRDLTQLRANRQKTAQQNEAKEGDRWLQQQLANMNNRPRLDMYGRYLPDLPAGVERNQPNEPNFPVDESEETAPRL